MKKSIKIIFILSFITFGLQAKEKEKKTIVIEDQLISLIKKDLDNYGITLMAHAAQYWGNKKHFSCFEASIKNRQPVSLKVEPFSLEILECQLSKK